MPIRVLVADRLPVLRSGFRALLSGAPDLDVVGEAADGGPAVEAARLLLPDVVLMDVRPAAETGTPGDGAAGVRRITADPALRRVRVLAVSDDDGERTVLGALRAGAAGFLLKDAGSAELAEAVRAVARGDALISPRATRRLIDRFTALPEPPAVAGTALGTLSARELDVLRMVAAGCANGAIAECLCLSPYTVKTYLQRVMRKLDAHDRAQLVVIAYRTGLARADQAAGVTG